jgi:hypothetical protein
MERISIIIFIVFILVLFILSAILRLKDARKKVNLSEDNRFQKSYHTFGIVTSIILIVGVSIVAILVFLSFLIQKNP